MTDASSVDGLRRFAASVAERLRDLPREQQAEIEADVEDRLASAGTRTYDDAVAVHGSPDAYADELREAMGLPPRDDRSGGTRRVVAALSILLAIVLLGAVWAWQGHDGIDSHPLTFASSMTSGAATTVGTVVVMPVVPGTAATVGVQVVNTSDRIVQVESVRAFIGARAVAGGLSWGAELPPLWRPAARVFPQADAIGTIIAEFDDPSGFDFHPFSIEPGAAVVIQFRGETEYCVDAPGLGIGDHIALNISTDGHSIVVEGTELSYTFGDCS